MVQEENAGKLNFFLWLDQSATRWHYLPLANAKGIA